MVQIRNHRSRILIEKILPVTVESYLGSIFLIHLEDVMLYFFNPIHGNIREVEDMDFAGQCLQKLGANFRAILQQHFVTSGLMNC